MKHPKFASNTGNAIPPAHPKSKARLATLLATVACVSWTVPLALGQSPIGSLEGGEVLTRGPVHEAFAGMVSYNPEPGIVVSAAPPGIIEEIPPEERPEGNDVSWIPGYWGWDDERNDYLWISGTWRALPPGREWMPGYWTDSGKGYQWISGYWANAAVRETTYLPPPPLTLEVGANVAAPSMDYGWTPGCWVWLQTRYVWRAGYWAQGRADWIWIPAYYTWTPRGVIFVEGFWDYPVQQRGLLFAPVYYQSPVYARQGYRYSPRIVINLAIFTDHLFLRPSYHHYYFGDYYGPRYDQGGFFASFSYQSSRYGYEPLYSHTRWQHRQDREWESRFQLSYQYRRENEIARPPRTWAAQSARPADLVVAGQSRELMAAPMEELASREDNPVRFRPVAPEERERLTQRGPEVQQSRDQRRTLEANASAPTQAGPGAPAGPAVVQHSRSPIVAKSSRELPRRQGPPEVPKTPKPDPDIQPRTEAPSPGSTRPQAPGQATPRTEAPAPGSTRPQAPGQATPRRNDPAPPAPGAPQASGQSQNSPTAATKAQQEAQRNALQETGQRAHAAAAKTREDAQRNAQASDANAQRARDAALKAGAAARSKPAESQAPKEKPAGENDGPKREKGKPAGR